MFKTDPGKTAGKCAAAAAFAARVRKSGRMSGGVTREGVPFRASPSQWQGE